MYVTHTATKKIAKGHLYKKFCKDLDKKVLNDLRSRIAMIPSLRSYIFDKTTGRFWDKQHICQQLRKGITYGQWAAMGFNTWASYYGSHKNIAIEEEKIIAQNFDPWRAGAIAYTASIPAIINLINLPKANYNRAVKDLERKEAKRIAKLKKLKPLPKHKDIHELRRKLAKRRLRFNILHLMKPNGELRNKQEIQQAISIY